MCIRHGIEIIYHASFADEEALDLLEANKDKHFVAPGLAWLIRISNHAARMGHHAGEGVEPWAITVELEIAIETAKKMKRRGIRVLPGGDYGFAWTAARHLCPGLRVFRRSPRLHADGGAGRRDQASAARSWDRRGELGQVKEGYLADIILVDGDPLSNIKILQDKKRILCRHEGRRVLPRPGRARARAGRGRCKAADDRAPRRVWRGVTRGVVWANDEQG